MNGKHFGVSDLKRELVRGKRLGAIGAFRVCLEAIKQADERHGDKRISFGEVKGEIEIRLSEEKEGIFTLGEEEGRVLRELNHLATIIYAEMPNSSSYASINSLIKTKIRELKELG